MSLKLELLAAICLISFEPSTEAHDIYSPLKDRWGNSCCSDQDCRPVPYRVTPAGVQMLVHGNWIAVPDHVIQAVQSWHGQGCLVVHMAPQPAGRVLNGSDQTLHGIRIEMKI